MASFFSDNAVDRSLLKRRAFNHRWAEVPDDVIPLTAADPDFPVAPEIREAIIDYTRGGYFSYGPPTGLPGFREAIAETLTTRKGIDATPDLVLPIDSAARGMFLIADVALEPGDDAIIFDPVDFLFKQAVLNAGGTVSLCPVDSATGAFELDALEDLVTERTRLIGLCNPHNPVGRVMTPSELETVLAFADRHDLWIMSDEIWSDIVYGEQEFTSILELGRDRNRKTVTVYGFSKTFGLAGLRAGYLLCPNREVYDLIVSASKVSTTAGGIATISQVAAETAYRKCWYWVDQFLDHLRSVRDHAVRRLSGMPGVSCPRPQGTYVLFPDVSSFPIGIEELVRFMAEEERVAVVPGSERYFGPGGVGHIRICFSTSFGILDEGLDRLERGFAKLASDFQPNSMEV
jgi:aspartate/methionine/tyrosine aminotransferase